MEDVTIVDSSPRDCPIALPNVRTVDKIALVNKLVQSGLTKIDCVSFTHPRIRPEWADAEEIINAVEKWPQRLFIGMAPNEVACRRALNTCINEIGVVIACTESFNQSVLGTSIKETLYKTFPAIFQACLEKGKPSESISFAPLVVNLRGRYRLKILSNLGANLSLWGPTKYHLSTRPA